MADPSYRVFLSHSSKDKDFVRELYRRLTRDGVACFFDIESIGWGQNWVKALERALEECEFVVFVLSPDFCNSEWVEVERTSSIADDPAGLKRKVRPLMLRPCRDLPTFPRFLRQVQAIDVSTIENFEQNYPRICDELGGTLRGDTALIDRTKLPPVGPLPNRNRMPYRSLGEKFIGRVDSFWNLYDCLFRDGTTILAGETVVAGIVTVNTDGTVRDVTIKHPAGTPLEEAVVKAVSKWVFVPAKKGGKVVACRISIPFSFKSQSGELTVDLGHCTGE